MSTQSTKSSFSIGDTSRPSDRDSFDGDQGFPQNEISPFPTANSTGPVNRKSKRGLGIMNSLGDEKTDIMTPNNNSDTHHQQQDHHPSSLQSQYHSPPNPSHNNQNNQQNQQNQQNNGYLYEFHQSFRDFGFSNFTLGSIWDATQRHIMSHIASPRDDSLILTRSNHRTQQQHQQGQSGSQYDDDDHLAHYEPGSGGLKKDSTHHHQVSAAIVSDISSLSPTNYRDGKGQKETKNQDNYHENDLNYNHSGTQNLYFHDDFDQTLISPHQHNPTTSINGSELSDMQYISADRLSLDNSRTKHYTQRSNNLELITSTPQITRLTTTPRGHGDSMDDAKGTSDDNNGSGSYLPVPVLRPTGSSTLKNNNTSGASDDLDLSSPRGQLWSLNDDLYYQRPKRQIAQICESMSKFGQMGLNELSGNSNDQDSTDTSDTSLAQVGSVDESFNQIVGENGKNTTHKRRSVRFEGDATDQGQQKTSTTSLQRFNSTIDRQQQQSNQYHERPSSSTTFIDKEGQNGDNNNIFNLKLATQPSHNSIANNVDLYQPSPMGDLVTPLLTTEQIKALRLNNLNNDHDDHNHHCHHNHHRDMDTATVYSSSSHSHSVLGAGSNYQYSTASTYATTLLSIRHFSPFVGARGFVSPWAQLPFISTGYRINYNSQDCLKSLCSLHNETCNVWTHVLGWFIFIGLFIYRYNTLLYTLLDENDPAHYNPLLFYTFVLYYIGTSICMVLSGVYHLLGCMSEEAHTKLYRLDMSGVIVMIIANFIMPVMVTFDCHRNLAIGYAIGALIGGSILIMMQNMDYFQQPKWYVTRISLLISFAGLVFVPYGQYFTLGDFDRALKLTTVIGISVLWYILGLLFWVFKFPENIITFQNWFDMGLYSHGFWHACIIIASLWTEQGFVRELAKVLDEPTPCGAVASVATAVITSGLETLIK